MKNRKTAQYRIDLTVFSDSDLKAMIEKIITHRENLIKYGSPYPPEDESEESAAMHKEIIDQKIAECKRRIKDLDETRERYQSLLKVVYAEEAGNKKGPPDGDTEEK